MLPWRNPVLVGAASYYLLPLPRLLLLLLLSCCLQVFDSIQEGELSTISRLAAEREDNMMWKEFRERLLRNIGLVSATLRFWMCEYFTTHSMCTVYYSNPSRAVPGAGSIDY